MPDDTMKIRILESINAPEPPRDLKPALRALWWLRKGGLRTGPEWDRAHDICQAAEGTAALDRIHALMHWIEGDMGNADYWYRASGSRRAHPDVENEWAQQVADLGA